MAYHRFMATIYLIRHGETPTTGKILPGRAPGLHLSEKGRMQAAAVAKQLASVDAVYSSPLERARETALPTCERFHKELMLDDGLLEADFGTWTGESLADLATLPEWQMVQRRPGEFRFPGGESFVEMQHRVVGCVRTIAARHPGEAVACFTHADPIKAALAHFTGRGWGAFQQIPAEPCSVSELEL
nr:phosphoglycerate mutase [Streptococcus thermophilus]